MSIRSFLFVGVVAVTVLPRQAHTQSATAAATTAAAVPNRASTDRVKRVPVSKAVFGDAAVIVNARDDGFIEIAAAGPTKTVFLQLRTMAARAWLDSTGRMMRARPRRSPEPKSYRADITEYGSNASMAMHRTITGRESAYSLAFADGPARFTVPIEPSEADVFVAILRKAVAQSVKMLEKPDTTARPDSAPKPVQKKKPATKRTSPPAKTADTTSAQPKATQPPPTIFKPAPKPATTKPATTKPVTTKPTQPA